MSYSQDEGYLPVSIETIMLSIMENINTQFGTSYTEETFVGTNFYKYFYALAQRMQENEVKTSEIFLKLQDYFRLTNEAISRPVVTNPGLVEALEGAGFIASVKEPLDADAGKIYICVDLDDEADEYASQKLEVCELIRDSTVAGCVTQGSEVEELTLSNGQAFDFKFDLPDRTTIHLRLTITLSENNQSVILSPEDTKNLLLANIAERYRLGKNFEPQTYFGIVDAPWASQVLLEWSDDAGSTWHDEVYDAAYDDLFEVSLANTTLVEA